MLLTKNVPDMSRKGTADIGLRLAMQKGVRQYPSPEIELFILANFLSREECDSLIEAMEGTWKPSGIVDDLGIENFRTSETYHVDSTNPVVAALEDRIIALTGLDPLHGEPIQGQRYGVGQEFKAHTDYFEPNGESFKRHCSRSGQRTWTVMIYLNEPAAGGDTFFTKLGIGARPETGTLLAWNNMSPDGSPNHSTLHHGMPVEKGMKYILTKWFRERPWPWPEEIAQRLATGRRFDGAPSASLASVAPPAARAKPEPEASGQTALKRRDWILAVKQELLGLVDDHGEVARTRNLSADVFLRHHYAAGRPVIIQGEIDDWPALGLWNPGYLKQKVGPAPVEFLGRRSAEARCELQKEPDKRTLAFGDYVDLITEQPGNGGCIAADNSKVNSTALECLVDDVRPISKFLRGAPGMPWIGPLGTFTPLHFDLTNNLVAQAVGSKRVILLPPSETRLLYNHRDMFSAVHDIMDEEALQKYPLARNAVSYEFELEAGELLFIPIGWWHQETTLDFSVSFTFVDFLWKNDFHETFPPG